MKNWTQIFRDDIFVEKNQHGKKCDLSIVLN